MTLKAKHEALKELDKNRPNKEVVIQFNFPGETLATWKKKNLQSFSKFITETIKSQSGNIWKYQLCIAEVVYNIPISGPIILERALEKPIQNHFRKAGISSKSPESAMNEDDDPFK